MSQTVEAYALWDTDKNEFYPPKKSGVPKIWSLEKQALSAKNSNVRDNTWRQSFWDAHPQYRHSSSRPPDLHLDIIKVEIKKL